MTALRAVLAVCLFGLWGLASANAAEPASWTNPLIAQRADPQIMLHSDGYYYCTATVPEYDRIELRRARSIAGLATAEVKTIWRKHASGPMGAHIWAPEIHATDGTWYIYFSAGDAQAKWNIRLYVLANSAADPFTGEWTEKGKIATNWESFTLDATTFTHRGRRYLAWAQSAADPKKKGTAIYLAEMATPWSIRGTQVMLTQPELAWERKGHDVNEGPAFLTSHGKVFLTYSASATDANYCLGMLTADADADLLAPGAWRKSQFPVLASANGVFGPGHNSFTTTPDGAIDLLVYHARSYEKITGDALNNPDRAVRVQPIHWKVDGTPDFSAPLADGVVTLDR